VGGEQRWLLAPGGRNLGRVWITVVFATLTVAGVFVVAVVGIRSSHRAVTMAERAEDAVDASILLSRAILALQDERGLAELWLTAPSSEIRAAYSATQDVTDATLESLRIGWQVRREVLDAAGPPTLEDLEDGVVPLTELRDATLRVREDSTVEAYTGVIGVVVAAARRTEVIAADSPLSSRVRALVRILEAGEALSRQRDVVVAILTGEPQVSQDELVRLLLLEQEARTNLASIRALGVSQISTGISEFLAGMSADDAQRLLAEIESGDNVISPQLWYDAATERLDTLRLLDEQVAGNLAAEAQRLRESAESRSRWGTFGLVALLSVSVLAGSAAVGAARERARALHEHGDLAVGLFEWFLPERLVDVDGVRVAARYDAASEYTRAGGDWYDVYRTKDGRVALTIGDVAGHGAAATAQMAQARNLLRGITLAGGGSPAEQMAALDEALRGSGTMATVFHALLDTERGALVYVRAGHPVGLIRAQGAVGRLDGALGSPVGVESENVYEDVTVALTGPWQILVFTDGLVEERHEDIEVGLAAIAARLAASTDDIDQLADAIIEARPERLDDAALMILSVDGAPSSARPSRRT
jgi:hypothetical protein